MHDLTDAAALAEQLHTSSRALHSLAEGVSFETRPGARVDLSGWHGPASWACHIALAVLEREIAVAAELIYGSANLAQAAAWEVQARG